MRGGMRAIIKKEMARFFGDRRLFFTTVIMPGLMIIVIYSVVGVVMAQQLLSSGGDAYEVAVMRPPESFCRLAGGDERLRIEEASPTDAMLWKDRVAAGRASLYVCFPESFDERVAAYAPGGGAAPQVEIYYDSADTASMVAYGLVTDMLDAYEDSLANKFDVNAGEESYDLATEREATGQIFSMLMPMLLMAFTFSGCVSIAPESIAGEKERGTIATLLVTPVRRGDLALGKIISLSVMGLLSGISSFIGMLVALPVMMGGFSEEAGTAAVSAGVYGVFDYAMLLLVILSSVLLIVGAISVISGLAKSVKEAGTAATPLTLLVILCGLMSMSGAGAPKGAAFYMIPFLNSYQCMNAIFSFEPSLIAIAVTVCSNVAYTLALAFALAKIFDSERMMYL